MSEILLCNIILASLLKWVLITSSKVLTLSLQNILTDITQIKQVLTERLTLSKVPHSRELNIKLLEMEKFRFLKVKVRLTTQYHLLLKVEMIALKENSVFLSLLNSHQALKEKDNSLN